MGGSLCKLGSTKCTGKYFVQVVVQKYWDVLCASFVQEILCASLVVQSSTGKYFVQVVVQSSTGTCFVQAL